VTPVLFAIYIVPTVVFILDMFPVLMLVVARSVPVVILEAFRDVVVVSIT
jgi:hypothetical protein